MSQFYIYRLNVIFILLFLVGCSKSKEPKPIIIDVAFQKYVDIFLAEAQKRNIEFNLADDGITVQFGSTLLNGKEYGGLSIPTTRTININKNLWETSSELGRESLILHELGHLLLKRIHKSTVLGNNEAQSLMASIDDSNFKSLPIYQGFRKKYYLDELFTPSTPTPEWANSELINTPESTSPKTLIYEQNFDKAIQLAPNLSSNTNISFDFSDGNMSIKNTSTSTEYAYGIGSFLTNFTPTILNNYEVTYRFRNKGNKGASLIWEQNNLDENRYLFGIKIPGATLINAISGYFYAIVNANSAGDYNIISVRYENSNVNVWINGKLIFKGNAVSTAPNDAWNCLIHLPTDSAIDVDYIKVYRL
ncbi:MAG: hypothetical protein ACOVO2_17315 [Emticicia sp.]|uniref:hypothetical protein n=1 Tax=Emticicia sp. TaxID=1930953 RepID=UPI003BA72A0D